MIESHPIERILVLQNPVSKNGARGMRQLTDLVEYSGLPYITVETSRDQDATIDRLGLLEPTDLLYVIGGDGTVNSTIQPAMRTGALLLPTRSGNANDLAMSMNGRKEPWQILSDYELGNASAIAARPIEIGICEGSSQVTKFAVNYTSFGYAALASHYINRPWRHDSVGRAIQALPKSLQSVARLPKEGYALATAARDVEQFEFTPKGAANALNVVDVSISHSSRMAKFGRFPIQHDDEFMLAATLAKSGIFALGIQFAKMMRGNMEVDRVEELAFGIARTTDQELYSQVDGEASRLPDIADITVGLGRRPLRIISSRIS